MRFGAHQTFHLRESWLPKGLLAVSHDPQSFSNPEIAEELGIGKNMAESLAYWLTACQMVKKDGNGLILTSDARLILEQDPFLELDGTLVLLHYLLVTNQAEATAFYWYFNKFSAHEFDTEALDLYLKTYVANNGSKSVNDSTLMKDVRCLLSMYRKPEYDDRVTPESENPSPFDKFNLIRKHGSKFVRGSFDPRELDPLVFVCLVYKFWQQHLGGAASISFEEICTADMSPGLALGLNEDQVLFLIEMMEKIYPQKYLSFSRTGGYFIINVLENSAKNAMTDYYRNHQELLR